MNRLVVAKVSNLETAYAIIESSFNLTIFLINFKLLEIKITS